MDAQGQEAEERGNRMITLTGKYTTAKVFTDNAEQQALDDIKALLNEPAMEGTQVRVMPDVHAGKGSTIGTSIMLPTGAKVIPNIVGGDMNCGMLAQKVSAINVDFEKLDRVINEEIPAGRNHNKTPRISEAFFDQEISNHLSFKMTDKQKKAAWESIGTLGGGNHFIELDIDQDGFYWLVVHSGSRSFGQVVNRHHQAIADANIHAQDYYKLSQAIIGESKKSGEERMIEPRLEALKQQLKTQTYQGFLWGQELEDYMNDAEATWTYADMSRHLMLTVICEAMGWETEDEFTSMHNFVDVYHQILRKGATPAYAGQRLIIPLNMRDGSIIGIGKGNPDWNYSAPHGAGRRMSRHQAVKDIPLSQFKADMAGIHTSSVCQSTLDEAPEAYKNPSDILNYVGDTMDVLDIIKPVYNFKAHAEGDANA